VLAKSSELEALLATVARRVDIIEDRAERNEMAACAQLLAGINFEKSLINLYLREELMRESVVYQSIVAESRQKGLQEGQGIGLEKRKGLSLDFSRESKGGKLILCCVF
jgi:predicted transposase YdaD